MLQALSHKYILLYPFPKICSDCTNLCPPTPGGNWSVDRPHAFCFSVWVARWFREGSLVLKEIVFCNLDERSPNNKGAPSFGKMAPPDDSDSGSSDSKCDGLILEFLKIFY